MLTIKIKNMDFYDENRNEFVSIPETTLKLEHSLLSISKWESKWHKPFLSNNEEKTEEQARDYVKCMVTNCSPDDMVFDALTQNDIQTINRYIEDPMTATWFSDKQNKKFSREIITNEIVYYWMTELSIPFSCEKWHINRLLTLIRVCNEKNAPSKKMSKRDILNSNRALNEARRKKHGSRG